MTAIITPTHHIAKLALKEAPGSGDDFYNLDDGVNFILDSYAEGDGRLDEETGLVVRDITLQFLIQDTNAATLATRWRKILYWINRTNSYIDAFGGNIPLRSDGRWFTGQALTLTWQRMGSQGEVYWYVVRASEPKVDTLANIEPKALKNVSLTLTCLALARGARVDGLNNVVRCGDDAPPFLVNDSTGNFSAGYSVGSLTDFTISTDFPLFGNYSTKWSGTVSNGLNTNGGTVSTGDIVIPSLWIRGLINSGSLTVVMQIFNGSTWPTQQTITISPAISNTAWQQYKGVAYTVAAGITQVRLTITSPTNGTLYFAGRAIWRNPPNNAVPTEFVTGGYSTRISYFNVYNTQGDTAAPFKMRIASPDSTGKRIWLIGGQAYDTSIEYPIFPLDIKPIGKLTGNFANSLYNRNGLYVVLDQGTIAYDAAGAYASSDTDRDNFSMDTGVLDYTFTTVVIGQFDAANFRIPAIKFRGIDANNYLYVQLYNATVTLYKKETGPVFTPLASAACTTTNNVPITIQIVAAGNSLTITVKDAAGNSLGNTSATLAGADATKFNGATATRVGAHLVKGGTPSVAARWVSYTLTYTQATAASTLPWGTKGITLPGTVGTPLSSPLWWFDNSFANRTIDRTPRRYRPLIVAALNTFVGSASSPKLSMKINGEKRDLIMSGAPANYSSSNPPGDTDYRIYDTNDLQFARPGYSAIDKTDILGGGSFESLFQLATFSSQGASAAGLVLLPVEQFCKIDLGASQTVYALEINSEGVGPRVLFDDTGSDSALKELNFLTGAGDTGGEFCLEASDQTSGKLVTRYEILPLRDQSASGGWTFDAGDSYQPSISYTPRYRSGMV